MLNVDELTYEEKKVAKVKMMKSLLFFTRFFFLVRFKRKFIVNYHHEKISQTVADVISRKIKKKYIIFNVAPRYGKTEIVVKNLIAQQLGINPSSMWLHLSYSKSLALDNAEEVKDIVRSEEYASFFPETKIKQGSNSKEKWYTTKGGGMYSTSTNGQVTGFGAGCVQNEEEDEDNVKEAFDMIEEFGGGVVIDDPIKPQDAESSVIRNSINARFESTLKNRVNSRYTPFFIIMQRVHPDDLCGYLLREYPDDCYVVKFPCIRIIDGVETALWDFKHTLEELYKERGSSNISIATFERQYQQNPKPLQGLLYTNLMTYTKLPFNIDEVVKASYTDTADTGADYLCTVVFVAYDKEIYIIDVQYNDKPQEVTEPETAELLTKNNVNYSLVESNNGGRAFARNITRIMRENGNNRTEVGWFHQSQNKNSRITTNASTVQNIMKFPDNWGQRWSKFYNDVTMYMASGVNEHDDAPDVLTGVVEMVENGDGGRVT